MTGKMVPEKTISSRELNLYRGAWGTAFLYGFGFLLVAHHPVRHTGVVIMGGLGKALFALNLLGMYLNG